jgi:hypothetical protein
MALDFSGWSDAGGPAPVVDDGSTQTAWERTLDDVLNAGIKIAQIVVGPPQPVGGVGVRPPAPIPGGGAGGSIPQQPGPIMPGMPALQQMVPLLLMAAIFFLILAFISKKKAA